MCLTIQFKQDPEGRIWVRFNEGMWMFAGDTAEAAARFVNEMRLLPKRVREPRF